MIADVLPPETVSRLAALLGGRGAQRWECRRCAVRWFGAARCWYCERKDATFLR